MGQAVDWLTACGSVPPGGWRVVAFAHGTLGGPDRAPCAMGGSVTIQFDPANGHSQANIPDMLVWIGDRFAGILVTNDC